MLKYEDIDDNSKIIITEEYIYHKVIHDYFVRNPFFAVKFKDNLDIEKLLEAYSDKILSMRKDKSDEKFEYHHISIEIEKNVFLIMEGGYPNDWFIASNNMKDAERVFDEVFERFHTGKDKMEPAHFFLMKNDHHGISTAKIDLAESYLRKEEELKLCYGDDILLWKKHWYEVLNQAHKGLTIFEGPPGTGKTSFIRHMISEFCQDLYFFYIPNNQFHLLNNLDTIDFWMNFGRHTRMSRRKLGVDAVDDNKIKVVILEDAESVLMERGGDNQQVVSNLLNMTDGLMGDAFNIHFICTVNCDLDNIDPALKRKGRLLSLRKFNNMNYDQACEYCRYMEIKIPMDGKEFSLAEIHANTNEMNLNLLSDDIIGRVNKGSLGFA
jgi:hypothetical protein